MNPNQRRRLRRAWMLELSLALAIAATLAVVSSARGASLRSVQPLTVANATHMPVARLAEVEQAVTIQVNRQVDAYWTGRPHIRFVPAGGWQITLVRGAVMSAHGFCAYHNAGVEPFAVVGLSADCGGWTVTFSHEVVEMVVDPFINTFVNGSLAEVSDPVNGNGYSIKGVRVSDFVTPSFYWRSFGLVWDQMGLLASRGASAAPRAGRSGS